MDMIKRRDAQMAYISDDRVFEEQAACRRILQKLNFMDTIGDNVWIGGNSVICPGVTIASNTVIGAGSVVTRDIPAWSVAAGNPCRVIRAITEEDRRKLFRQEDIDDEAWADIVTHMEFPERS